jgi:8-oxo-dGTP pyrophosphatase MutT (NUDIX family)
VMDLDPRLHFVSATAIVAKKATNGEVRFLIMKRVPTEKAFPNKWTVPGGKLVQSEYETLPTTQASSRDEREAGEGSGWELKAPPVSESREADVGNRGLPRRSEAPTPQWYNMMEWLVRKEVREEAGIEIEKPTYLTDLVFIRPDGYPVVTLSFRAKYKSGEVKLNGEMTEFAWVTVEEAKNYDLIEGIWEEIRDVEKLV